MREKPPAFMTFQNKNSMAKCETCGIGSQHSFCKSNRAQLVIIRQWHASNKNDSNFFWT